MDKRGFSNSMYVAELRYIQSLHEPRDFKNPDRFVGHFLPLLRRWRCKLLSRKSLSSLRKDPFYYYLVARTKYYDKVFIDSIADGTALIINIGCGVDTRACRFEQILRENNIQVMECDQPAAISFKQAMAGKLSNFRHITYAPIDLNDDSWPALKYWLAGKRGKATALLEGVSPYIDVQSFGLFLKFLRGALTAGSVVAYDFKIDGVSDTFGQMGRTQQPFRLSANRTDVVEYHEGLGFDLISFERSSDLSSRILPCPKSIVPFTEDALVQLKVS